MPDRNASKPLLAQRLKQLTPRPIKKFAEKIGVDPRRYYAWLAGERPPDATLAVIARALHVSLDDLLASESDDATGPVPRGAVPVLGRAAAGPLAPAESSAQTVRLDIAGLRVTIRVEKASKEGGGS